MTKKVNYSKLFGSYIDTTINPIKININNEMVLKKRLADSQERLKTVEKIMQEKDDRISELENQLTEILAQFKEYPFCLKCRLRI